MADKLSTLSRTFVEMIYKDKDRLPLFYHKLVEMHKTIESFFKYLSLTGKLSGQLEIVTFADETLLELAMIDYPKFASTILGTFDFQIDGKPIMESKEIRATHDKLMKSSHTIFITEFLTQTRSFQENYKKEQIKRLDNIIGNFPGGMLLLFSSELQNCNLYDFWTQNPNHYHSCMRNLITAAEKVYETIMIPDLDSVSVSELISNTLDKIESQPQFQNNKEGFMILRKSTYLLQQNFDSYYRDYIHSGNVFIFFENYVRDLSTSDANKHSNQLQKIMTLLSESARQKMLQSNVSMESIKKLDALKKEASNF